MVCDLSKTGSEMSSQFTSFSSLYFFDFFPFFLRFLLFTKIVSEVYSHIAVTQPHNAFFRQFAGVKDHLKGQYQPCQCQPLNFNIKFPILSFKRGASSHRPLERYLTRVKNVTQRDMCFRVQNDPGKNVY